MNLIRSYLVNVFLWILVYLQISYKITLGTMGRARTTWLWTQSHSVLCSPIFGLNPTNRKITVTGLVLESQEKRPVKDTISKENITPPTLNIQWGGLIDIMKAFFCYYFVAERFSILIHVWPMFPFFHFILLENTRKLLVFWCFQRV